MEEKTMKSNFPQSDSNEPGVAIARKIQANVEAKKENNICIDLDAKVIRCWYGDMPIKDVSVEFKLTDEKFAGYHYLGEDEKIKGTAIYANDTHAFLVARYDNICAILFPFDSIFLLAVAHPAKNNYSLIDPQVAVYFKHEVFRNKGLRLLFSGEEPLPFGSIKEPRLSDYISDLLKI
jgi:hypothetical protein